MALKDSTIEQLEAQAIAKNLAQLIKKNNKTDSEIASDLNVPVMTIKRLLSGETTDPRVYTLKTIANYFEVTVDSLLEENDGNKMHIESKNKPIFVPILNWEILEQHKKVSDINLEKWSHWQPINVGRNYEIKNDVFALESRPSMYPRFEAGTLFVIDPNIKPADGDTVLVRIKNNGLTLRIIQIDPPVWQLKSLSDGSNNLAYEKSIHEIIGVVFLTIFYSKNVHQ